MESDMEEHMANVGAYEAKTHLPKLIERVMKGERITILRHGTPVAVLQSPDPARPADPGKTIEALRAFRRKHRLDGMSVKELIEQGRR